MKNEEKRWSKIEIGARCYYGVIIGVWKDDFIPSHSWVFIRNDDPVLWEGTTYTLYKFDPTVSGGLFSVPHFIPDSVIRGIAELDLGLPKSSKSKNSK